MAVLAVEKELSVIDKQINSFKRQMELSRKKLSHQTTVSHMNAYTKSRHSRSKSVSLIDLDNVQSSSCNIPYSKKSSVLDIQTTQNATNHNSAVDNLITDISTSMEEKKAVTNTDVTTNDGAMEGTIPEISVSSTKLESNEEFMYNKRDLLCSVWMKCNRPTHDQKWRMTQNHTSETKDDVSENTQTQASKKVMRKCWDTWLHIVRKRKRTLSAAFSKQQREEKIDGFFKVLQEQKWSLIDIRVPGTIKDLHNVKKGTVRNSKHFNHNFQPNNKRFDKQDIQHNSGFQTKHSPKHRNNEYLKRLEVQQNIITEQKSKLEEQSRLIKELQLAQLRMQTEKSAKEAQAEISQTLSSCELSLKPKAKQVKNRLSVTEKKMVFPERKLVVTSLKTVPAILNRMEERAEERQRRWKLIRERKQKLIEERLEKEREEEEERKQREENEKQLKVQELREKRRLKKQMENQKKTEREKMHNLMIMASFHYKNLLMKKVICSLKQLVVLKWKMMESAEEHCRTRLVCHYFHTWREHVNSVITMKMNRATSWHNRVLMKKVFRCLFQVSKNQNNIKLKLLLHKHIKILCLHFY
jgi:hypothetical protein